MTMRRRTPRLRPAEVPAKRTTRTVTKKADIAAGAKALFTKSAAKKAGSAYLDLMKKTTLPGLAGMLGRKVGKHVRGEKSPEKKNKK